jgi:hypothetical protein
MFFNFLWNTPEYFKLPMPMPVVNVVSTYKSTSFGQLFLLWAKKIPNEFDGKNYCVHVQ